MMRGCPATGRMFHQFDKTTHRCKCGRWERGFKPAKAPVCPRAECQICCGTQALAKDGTLVHHGYTRPGCGWIQGDCMGVGHLPYPATDALELYLAAVRGHAERLQARLAELPTLDVLDYHHTSYNMGRKEPRVAQIARGAETCYRQGFPSFDDLMARTRDRLVRELAYAGEEEARVLARIEAAKKLQENSRI